MRDVRIERRVGFDVAFGTDDGNFDRLPARREVERHVAGELSAEVDERLEHLKRAIADQHGEALEATYRELGAALEQKRALAAHARAEAFRRVEGDQSFAPRVFLRLLAR